MKRDFESEYLSAVAKRTRASTERYLVAKVYGESGVRNRRNSVDIERSSDVVFVESDDEDEVDRDREVRAEVRIQADGRRGRGKGRGRGRGRGRGSMARFDDMPDSSPIGVGSDDDGSDVVFLGEEDDDEVEMVWKGKEKTVAEDESVDVAGVDVGGVSKGESESVRDNAECNVGGNGRCFGWTDGGDNSVGSRMELGSTSKPVEDALSFSICGNGVENENAREDDGNKVVFSSEAGSETEVSSSDSEADDNDEDFDVDMADVSCSSDSAYESDSEFVEESDVGDGRREERCQVESNMNASPCCSDDVIFLGENMCEKEILEKSVSYMKESVQKDTKGIGKVHLSPPYEFVSSGEKFIPKERVCCGETTPIVVGSFTGNGSSAKSAPTVKLFEDHTAKVDDTKGIGKVHLSPPYEVVSSGEKVIPKERVCCGESTPIVIGPFTGKGSLAKSAPTVKLFEEHTTKVDDFAWIVSENTNHSENKLTKCTRHTQGSAWDDGKPASQNNMNSMEFILPIDCPRMSKIVEKPFASKISGGIGFCRTGDDADKQEPQEVLEANGRKPNSTKRARTLEKINVFDAFFNSLTSKSAVVPEDTIITNVTQQEKHAELAVPKSNPMLKFTFGVKMRVQTEKTESEQELDDLWDEFQFGLRASEIGSLAHETVKSDKDTSSKNSNIYPSFCDRGEHTFILDSEIGIKCRVCSFVQLEMKHVMPDWMKSSSRKFDRRESSDVDDPEIFDGMQFHDSKVGESRSCSDGTVWDIIPEVKDKLYPHQRDGFEFIWLNLMGTISLDELQNSTYNGMGGCIISHAPGTGKTRLTIEFLHSYLELFPDSCPLIIAPAGMLLTWEAEFKKWDVGIPFHNLNSASLSGKEDTAASNIFFATKQSSNTHLLRLLKLLSWKKQKSILGLSYSLFEKLAGQRFDEEKKSKPSNKKTMDEQAKEFGKIILENAGLLILDEGHTPRNPRSRIYKALTNIQTKKRIILSGTPFQNNLAELYTILSFVRPDFAQMISPELRKFCQRKVRMVNVCSGRSGSEPDVDKDDREAISQLRYKIDPFVHVHKGSVLQESLPGLKDCVMVLNPPQYQKHIVEVIESSSYTNFEFEHKLSLATIHPSLLQTEKDESFIDNAELEARRLDPNEGVKTKFLFEMIRLSEANNERVLVFSQYLDPLGLIKDQICSLLHWHEGKEVLQLVGKVESEQRQSIINVFNDPRSSAKVLLASTKACSEGINLVGASRVVLLDVVWNPSVERQAISRAFRLGQKKVVYSYNLIVGRMEWEKYGAQTNKEHVSNLVFCSNDEPEKRGRVLSEDKILDELISHNSMEDMFDQIVYYPKDSLFS